MTALHLSTLLSHVLQWGSSLVSDGSRKWVVSVGGCHALLQAI